MKLGEVWIKQNALKDKQSAAKETIVMNIKLAAAFDNNQMTKVWQTQKESL